MLLILVIILLLLGSSVVGSIYSNFMVFYSNFFESENYHKAYYASISALERGELVTKQRQPGYIGSGGFILGIGTGSTYNSDGGSDKNLSGFSYIGNNENDTSVFRAINSRTTRIPASGQGDIERTLSANDSKHYNKMDYENAEVFLLYYDNKLDENPYKRINDNDLTKSNTNQITGEIRLPKLLRDRGFEPLDTEHAQVGQKGSLPNDDGIVDWQIRGNYKLGSDNIPFTIYSTQTIYFDSAGPERKVDYKNDSVFREKYINANLTFKFGDNRRSPISNAGTDVGTSVTPTIISQSEKEIYSALGSYRFQKIFTDSNFNKSQLRFSLLNLLGSGTSVYPFLEYYTDFGTIVPDKYYTINGEGNYKDYQINTIVQKPTVKETILGSFTSVFG